MSEELIDRYVDRAAFADDTKFATDHLKKVLDLFDKVNATKVTLGSATGMKDVVDSAKQAQAAMNELRAGKEKLIKVDLESAKASLLDAKAKKELALASKAEAQARKENAAAAILEAKALQGSAKAEKDRADALLKGQVLREKEEKQRIASQKQIDELADDYLQLSRAYTDAAKKAKNYSIALGENHPVAVAAVKDAKAMYDILLRVDQTVGQSQRQVGNYKEAFNGLSVSVSQIARELPSLAVSAQTFTLAISNNLPMLFDEIKKARVEIAALQAQGKETPTLMQRLGASIISWNVGLSIGVALLTALTGKIVDWAKGLFDADSATKKAKESQRQYNEVMQNAVELRERYNKTLNVDYGTIKRNLENDLAYARARGASEVEILQIEKKIADLRRDTADVEYGALDDKALDARKKALKEAEQAYEDYADKIGYIIVNGERTWYQMDSSDVSDDKKKELAALKKDFDEKEKLFNHDNAIVEEYHNANRDAQAKDIELQKALAEQRAKFFAEPLEKRRDTLSKLSEYEDFSLKQRISFVKEAANIEKEILRGKYNDEVISAKGNAFKILELNRKLKFDLDNIDDKERENKNTVRASEVKRLQELTELEIYTVKTRIGFAEEAAKVEKDIINDRYKNEAYAAKGNSDTLKALREKLAEDLLNIEQKLSGERIAIKRNEILRQRELDQEGIDLTKEGLKELEEKELQITQLRIKRRQDQDAINQDDEIKSLNKLYEEKIISEKEYQERRFQIEKYYSLKSQSDIIKDAQKLIQQRKDDGKDSIDLERQIADAKKAIDDELTARLIDNREKLKQKEKEIATLVITGIGQLISNGYDRQKNAIQSQIDQIDAKRQAETDGVNASIATEQEKAAKIANINAAAQNEKEKLQKRQRDLDVRKAQFEKVIGILKIGIDTQQSVVSLTTKAAQAKAEAALLLANPITAPYAPIAAAAAAAISAQVPLVLASSAIQAGLIAAQPIPRYKHGREGGPATLGVVGDGGVNEVIYSPDLKHAVVTPNTDTLAYIPKGYGVASSVEEFQAMAFKLSHKELPVMPVQQNSNEALIYAMAGSIGRLERAIMNKQETHFHWSNGELQMAIKNGNDWLRYVNANF